MADVTLERKESLSRQQAAVWLSALSKAFSHGGHVSLPMGRDTLGLEVPEHVRAEFEVEVDGDEVQVEIEFTWSTSHPARAAEPTAGT
jgi:amphi-Trp domain-containing protein